MKGSNDTPGLYIQLFSIHGLIRGSALELGRDADTGGQVKYVVELAKALAEQEQVAQVDLVTRLIKDRRVDAQYSEPIEQLSDKARIVRIQCGGRKYIRKELLWPHLDEFIDKTIRFLRDQGRYPDLFHGHYADAGYVAAGLAETFDTPFVFTGHSLGKNKRAKLIDDGLGEQKMERLYKIGKRIAVEEEIFSKADLIITSTQQEIERQYGLYEGFDSSVCTVIPPGIDLDIFYPYYDPLLDQELMDDEIKQTRLTLIQELHRFWTQPEKPFILALCRPDHRKNITGLLEAYGSSKGLQALANLAVFAGIRSDIKSMEENERQVLTDMLLQMDRFDLYGKLAIPKKHDFSKEVPELYRLCAESRGIFVNPALTEPFGLTLIEASACGLPIVATQDGGPNDIVANCDNGILVDTSDIGAIEAAITEILVDREKWDLFSYNGINGVRHHYSWHTHSANALQEYLRLLPEASYVEQNREREQQSQRRPSFGQRLESLKQMLIVDIDNTLVGDQASMEELLDLLDANRDHLAWGVSTGRSLELTLDAMTEYNIPLPDIIICSVGTEIYYGPELRHDQGWQQHISNKWDPEGIREQLGQISFLTLQEPEAQRSHKISYYMADDYDYLAWVYNIIEQSNLRCQVVFSHGQFLDVLPLRASKGKAVEYVIYKYKFSPRRVMVAGNSGSDSDMLSGRARGLVVGNYRPELDKLRHRRNIYFSPKPYAAGIIDGLRHYGLI